MDQILQTTEPASGRAATPDAIDQFAAVAQQTREVGERNGFTRIWRLSRAVQKLTEAYRANLISQRHAEILCMKLSLRIRDLLGQCAKSGVEPQGTDIDLLEEIRVMLGGPADPDGGSDQDLVFDPIPVKRHAAGG